MRRAESYNLLYILKRDISFFVQLVLYIWKLIIVIRYKMIWNNFSIKINDEKKNNYKISSIFIMFVEKIENVRLFCNKCEKILLFWIWCLKYSFDKINFWLVFRIFFNFLIPIANLFPNSKLFLHIFLQDKEYYLNTNYNIVNINQNFIWDQWKKYFLFQKILKFLIA